VDEEHWSFIPPKKAEPPALANATAVGNPVDAFIQEPLAKLGIPQHLSKIRAH
jgi:hypothetical protein